MSNLLYMMVRPGIGSRWEISAPVRRLQRQRDNWLKKFPEIKSYIVKEQPEAVIEKGSQKNAYSVQVGSHINLAYAENDLKQLKEMGFDGYVQPAVHEGETWYRLKVGDFSSREEATGAEKQLAQKLPELNSYIVEEELDAKERMKLSLLL